MIIISSLFSKIKNKIFTGYLLLADIFPMQVLIVVNWPQPHTNINFDCFKIDIFPRQTLSHDHQTFYMQSKLLDKR